MAKAISAEHALAASVKKADTAEASEEQKATMAEELAYNSPTAADVCNVGTKMSASRQADLDGGALHNRVEEDTNKVLHRGVYLLSDKLHNKSCLLGINIIIFTTTITIVGSLFSLCRLNFTLQLFLFLHCGTKKLHLFYFCSNLVKPHSI